MSSVLRFLLSQDPFPKKSDATARGMQLMESCEASKDSQAWMLLESGLHADALTCFTAVSNYCRPVHQHLRPWEGFAWD